MLYVKKQIRKEGKTQVKQLFVTIGEHYRTISNDGREIRERSLASNNY